ncbi:P-loop containing nucleoside triphosphate hydrolase protein, partial [Lasiosphaeria miniovina]
MEPVSALSVAGVALQLARLCISVPKALSDIKQKYNEAGKTIRNIKYFCKAVELAAGNIQDWLSSGAADQITGLADWKDILVGYVEAVQDLQDDLDKIVGSENWGSGSLLDRSQRAKVVWSQDTMQQHLENLQYLSSALHLLLAATKLSLDRQPDAVRQVWEDAKSMSLTRRSLSSKKDADPDVENTVRFAFDVILASSSVYQRASTFARAAPSAETDSSDSNSAAEDEPQARNDTNARVDGPRRISAFPEDGAEVVNAPEESSSPLSADPSESKVPSERYFNVPFDPPSNFYGRRDILSAIKNYFDKGETDAEVPICSLSGLGGVGKSYVAQEYAVASFQQSIYDSVWWINGESRISIAMSFSLINNRLNLTATNEPASHIRHVKRWLELSSSPWLLVFDNVENPTDLSDFFPKPPKARGSAIIITTRDPVVIPGQNNIQIPTFTHDEGVDFLLQLLKAGPRALVPETAHSALDKIVDRFSGLPLALPMVAGQIIETGAPVSEFLRRYSNFEAQAGTVDLYASEAYSKTLSDSLSLALARL